MTLEEILAVIDNINENSTEISLDLQEISSESLSQVYAKIGEKIVALSALPDGARMVLHLISLISQKESVSSHLYPMAYSDSQKPILSVSSESDSEADSELITDEQLRLNLFKYGIKNWPMAASIQETERDHVLLGLRRIIRSLQFVRYESVGNIILTLNWLRDLALNPVVGSDSVLSILTDPLDFSLKNVLVSLIQRENEELQLIIINWVKQGGINYNFSPSKIFELLFSQSPYIEKIIDARKITYNVRKAYYNLYKLVLLFTGFENRTLKFIKECYPKKDKLMLVIDSLPPAARLTCLKSIMNPANSIHQYLMLEGYGHKKRAQKLFNQYVQLSIVDLPSWIDMISQYDVIITNLQFFDDFKLADMPFEAQCELLNRIFSKTFFDKFYQRHMSCQLQFIRWFISIKRPNGYQPPVDLIKNTWMNKAIEPAFDEALEEFIVEPKQDVISWLQTDKTKPCKISLQQLSQEDWKGIATFLTTELIDHKNTPHYYEWLLDFVSHPHADMNIAIQLLREDITSKSAECKGTYQPIVLDMVLYETISDKLMRFLNALKNQNKMDSLMQILSIKSTTNHENIVVTMGYRNTNSYNHCMTILIKLLEFPAFYPVIRDIISNRTLNNTSFIYAVFHHNNHDYGNKMKTLDFLEQALQKKIMSPQLLADCLDKNINRSKDEVKNVPLILNKLASLDLQIKEMLKMAEDVAPSLPAPGIYPVLPKLPRVEVQPAPQPIEKNRAEDLIPGLAEVRGAAQPESAGIAQIMPFFPAVPSDKSELPELKKVENTNEKVALPS